MQVATLNSGATNTEQCRCSALILSTTVEQVWNCGPQVWPSVAHSCHSLVSEANLTTGAARSVVLGSILPFVPPRWEWDMAAGHTDLTTRRPPPASGHTLPKISEAKYCFGLGDKELVRVYLSKL